MLIAIDHGNFAIKTVNHSFVCRGVKGEGYCKNA